MSRRRDFGLFLTLAAVWGAAFVAIETGIRHVPPVLYAALRYDVAAVVTLAYCALAVEDWRPRSHADWATVAVGGAAIIAGYNAFLFLGQQYVTGAVAAVLVGLNPVLTTVLARALLPSERLGPAGVAGVGLGFVGVAVIARPDPSALWTGSTRGALLVFGAATSVAVGSVLVRRFDADVSTEGRVAWSMALGAVLLHAVSGALPSESLAAAEWTPTALWSLAYLALVASAFGYVIYFDLLDRLGAVEINLISYATPVTAAATGFVLLGHGVGVPTAVGFTCILAGFALVKRRAIRAELR
ncbi:MAG: DMT family transporter [Halobacteriaceae archaeon]